MKGTLRNEDDDNNWLLECIEQSDWMELPLNLKREKTFFQSSRDYKDVITKMSSIFVQFHGEKSHHFLLKKFKAEKMKS